MEVPRSPSFSPPFQAQMIAAKTNYNENYAMDINKMMRIPTQLTVGPSEEAVMNSDPSIPLQRSRINNEWMHVPERICVNGK